MTHRRSVKKGQTILYQGEAPSSIFLVKKGLVRAMNVGPNGDEKTIALYGPSDYFPIGLASDKSPVALFYYEAMADAELDVFDKSEFLNYLSSSTLTSELDRLATQYLSALLQINALGQTRARDRIMRIVQFLSVRFGKLLAGGVYTKIDIPLTQLDIASMAGLTRETTAVELGRLRRDNIIEVKHKFYAVHIKRLLATMGEEELDSVSL